MPSSYVNIFDRGPPVVVKWKDKLVIKTIQRTGKNILNTRRPNLNDSHQSNKSHWSGTECFNKPQQTKAMPLDHQNERKIHRNERTKIIHTHSEETTSSLENKSHFSEEDKTTYRSKTDKCKENVTKEIHKDVDMQCSKSRGQKISNRRKSMPASSHLEPIFSSDDDFDALSSTYLKKSHKDSWPSDERYNSRNNYPSKDMYNRKKQNNKSRHDRFIPGHTYRHSPEKYHTKRPNDNSESHRFRRESSKKRELRSPPTDKYNRSKSRDRRLNFEREKKHYKTDSHSPHHQNYSEIKHKISNEFEEPRIKRQKIEIISQSTIQDNIYNEREKEDLRDRFTNHQNVMETLSCQSPDNIDITIPHHVVKEIRPISSTELDDPRVSSKKYRLQNNEENRVLSTISKHIDIKPVNVTQWDIPNKNKFTLSVPLTTSCEEINKNITNGPSIGIKYPILNESIESGEIVNLKDYDNIFNSGDGANIDNMYENKKNNKNQHQSEISNDCVINSSELQKPVTNIYKIPKKKHDLFEKLTVSHNSGIKYSKINNENNEVVNDKDKTHLYDQNIEKAAILSFDVAKPVLIKPLESGEIRSLRDNENHCCADKINDTKSDKINDTKSDKINDTKSDKNVDRNELSGNLNAKPNKLQKPHSNEYKIPKIKILDKTVIKNDDVQLHDSVKSLGTTSNIDNLHNVKYRCDKIEKNNSIKVLPKKTLGTLGTLEEDLQLSDEGESKVLQMEKTCEKTLKNEKTRLNSVVESNKNKFISASLEDNTNTHIERKDPKKLEKETCRDSAKTKYKEKVEQGKSNFPETNKKTKEVTKRKVKECKTTVSNQTKNKFTDLFGDSSSLITPDDLGIPLPAIQIPSGDKHISLFDNTQDAVDLNIANINREKSNTTNTFQTVIEASGKDINVIENTSNNDENIVNSMHCNRGVEVTNEPVNILYENAKSETLNDASEIIKTVIISTGVQPKLTTEPVTLQNSQEDTKYQSEINNEKLYMKHCTLIKALATSTPNKTIQEGLSTVLIKSNSPTDVSNITEKTNNLSQSSNQNSEDIPNEDIPDVRIFVRRRRKITKKS